MGNNGLVDLEPCFSPVQHVRVVLALLDSRTASRKSFPSFHVGSDCSQRSRPIQLSQGLRLRAKPKIRL